MTRPARPFLFLYVLPGIFGTTIIIIPQKIGFFPRERRIGRKNYRAIFYGIMPRLRVLKILHIGINRHFINRQQALPYVACVPANVIDYSLIKA